MLPDDPSAVVLEVWVSGGLLPPEYSRNFPPIYWLTAGGTLYSEGSPPPVAPPPLLASLNETELTAAQLEAALDEIAASGLPEAGEEHISAPSDLVPEILTTELIFRDTAGDHVIRVEGLFAGMDTHADPRVPHLLALLEVFEEAKMDFTPYLGDRLQVITVFDVPRYRDEPPDRDERPWPLSNAPERDDDTRFSCRVFEGAEAAGLFETFATAHETTRWLLGEERFELLARALFPGEAGCRELTTGSETHAAQFSRWGLGRRSIPAERAAARRSSLRFGRNTPGIPLSRALSAGRLPGLGAHAGSTTGC